MKRMKRNFMKAKNQVTHIRTEQNVLSDTSSPWLVHLAYSFGNHKYMYLYSEIQSDHLFVDSIIYLIMEYVPGGDMRGLLNNLVCFSEQDAKFYIAEMILAVVDLHKLGYIHRDLKPENFLI